uniref:Uncharacterized protein n=1 Tax=Marathrum foeniculaceum TaxID=995770 RepID=A0A6M8TX70_9ROSI|nr:hypothetical protein RF1 [Marathrum foeniculaceum]YP_009869763.1 hypothetical protein RF1 [Marathrum foeniculaceum]QKJ81691.1 hypothetical protein RF1 [Marathrum foeniculaceum]QKJ81704.1 hypothetical protein RF1 [Marathrum foeniculaceum]
MRFRSCSLYKLYKLIPNTNKWFFLLKILNPGEVFAACLEKDELNLTLLQLYRPDIFSLWSKSGRSSIESNTPMFRLNSQFIL